MEIARLGCALERIYCVGVQDSSHTAEARRVATELAASLAFSETEAGNIALVVTEAAKNLLKHAGGGDLILRSLDYEGQPAVEMLAVDKGPGIEDIGRSFQDGYSTSGTPGTGLGAIARLSSHHEIYSQPRKGTALLAQIGRRTARSHHTAQGAGRFRIGAVSVAMSGQPVCGDAWSFLEHSGNSARLVVADGLGHGLLAADAARMAVQTARERPSESGDALMDRIHAALRPTRGAAVAVAEMDSSRGILHFTGIGNIAAALIPPEGPARHLVSHPGTAGHEVHKIAGFTYPWEPGSLLVMHSDGLGSHWSLDRYPGLPARHPSLIAGVLYRDFSRRRDDATVVVLQDVGGTA